MKVVGDRVAVELLAQFAAHPEKVVWGDSRARAECSGLREFAEEGHGAEEESGGEHKDRAEGEG